MFMFVQNTFLVTRYNIIFLLCVTYYYYIVVCNCDAVVFFSIIKKFVTLVSYIYYNMLFCIITIENTRAGQLIESFFFILNYIYLCVNEKWKILSKKVLIIFLNFR